MPGLACLAGSERFLNHLTSVNARVGWVGCMGKLLKLKSRAIGSGVSALRLLPMDNYGNSSYTTDNGVPDVAFLHTKEHACDSNPHYY